MQDTENYWILIQLQYYVMRDIYKILILLLSQSQVPAQNGSATRKWDDDITSKTYEDILATAILNKVL